ncbi:hypothetical protein V8F06_003759 [Rhypophila decipiens]
MPPIERDAPPLRHQHSASSDHGRALIPMWDSSDPERAPPPLPLNPQSPGGFHTSVSRAGTSSAIQSAHAALTEKARENALVPHVPSSQRRSENPSPERPLLRESTHRRMQSLQPSSVKDISLMLEGSASPTMARERPCTPPSRRDTFHSGGQDENKEENASKAMVTTTSIQPGPSLTPIVRPVVRRPPQSILGENTPPQSATMLALRDMSTSQTNPPVAAGPAPIPGTQKEAETTTTPLANITNNSSATTALVKVPQSIDALSSQILTLTNIATTLQKEMSQLSRRSRDNATDLLSLKEATNARDEDIRKSLRELISDARHKERSSTRDMYGGPLLLGDGRGGGYPSETGSNLGKSVRPFSLPRIPSPTSFAASLSADDATGSYLSTPSLMSDVSHHQSQATVALLEKVYRDMGTEEGQKTILARLTEISEKQLNGLVGQDKIDELIRLVKSGQQQQAVVPTSSSGGGGTGAGTRERGWSFDEHDDGARPPRQVGRLLPNLPPPGSSAAAQVLNDDVLKAIRTVKDSVAQGGGLTAEVKALVRELRGEVLGMGREIGRRLDESSSGTNKAADNSEVRRIVEQGIAEMQNAMNEVLREHRRSSSATSVSRDTSVDYKEIYNSMRAALKDSQASKPRGQELRREEVLSAVKDAWERYQPDIHVQQIGLERGEVLECLKEGLAQYAPRAGASPDEVFSAVVEGLKGWVPPKVETPATLSRDEILDAVRECLEEFEFPAPPPGGDLSKDDMRDAVREGLHTFDFPATPEVVTREDVLDAVNEGLHGFDFSAVQSSALVAPQVSKADVADAVKVGLKGLNNPLGQAEMLDIVREGVESLALPRDMVDAVKKGLESFDFASSALVPAAASVTKEDVAAALRDALGSLDVSEDVEVAVHNALHGFDFSAVIPRADISRVDVSDAVKEGIESLGLTEGVARAVKEGLQGLDLSSVQSSALVPLSSGGSSDEVMQRLHEIKEYLRAEFEAVSAEAKQNIAANGRDTEQVLDATKDGFDRLRQDIESYVDKAKGETDNQEFMDYLVSTLDRFRSEISELVARSSDSSRDVIKEEIESLRDTVNSSLVPALPQQAANGGGNNKEILEALHEGLGSLRTEISTRPIAGLTEILDALQEGLGDIRGSIEKLHNKPADLTANDEILDALKSGLDSVRSEIDELREESKNDRALATIGGDDAADVNNNAKAIITAEHMIKQDDIKSLEVLITQLGLKVEAMESTPPPPVDSLSKEDLSRMEDLLRDVAATVADMPSRQQQQPLEDMLRKVQDSVEEMASSAKSPAEAAERDLTDPASREDVQAIETILRNTKSRLDDLIDGEQAVRKDHIDHLETVLLETRENLGNLFSHLENVSRKEDITMVESLVTQIIGSFDEMKERHEKALEDPEKVTKTDIDAIEAVCLDMKSDLAQMVKAESETQASKEDISALELLLRDFRERLDAVAEGHTQQLVERQAETAGVSEKVGEVKSFLEEFQEIVKGRLEDGAKGIDAISGLLEGLGESIRKNANVSDDLKDMFETMKLEFEESRTGFISSKLESDEKLQVTTDALAARLDERIMELMVKYDEFQAANEERAVKGEARDVEMEAAFVSTKAVAEELKSLVDTLGTAVTDSLEKMEEASKTVFERVEELVSKSDENHADDKVEHQLTRDNIQEAIGKVDGLSGQVDEYQPKILEAIQDVMLVVGQHFEQSKLSVETIQQRIEDSKPPLLELPDKYYDDTAVVERLDKLVSHTEVADKAFEKFGTLDAVHDQVKKTAAELAVFMAAQTQRIADEHEDREKSLQETIVALERRLAEKEALEANLASLREEEAKMRETINVTLKEEQESIKHQFLVNLQEEEMRLKEMTTALRDEQEKLKELFMANLKEEQSRLMETNVALKEEQDLLKETFMASLKEEETRLKEMNDALRDEQALLKDTFLANLREEEGLLKEVNAGLREEAKELREEQRLIQQQFFKEFKEEEERLREANAALKSEQDAMRAAFREEQERIKAEVLANLLEEEARLKEANEILRSEQSSVKEEFLAGLKEEEERLKASLRAMRAEQEDLGRQKTRLAADLSSLDTALRIRREELHEMEERAEGLERRILEGVMDHSRVLLMAKTKRMNNNNNTGRESMSRKRVSSQSHKDINDSATRTNNLSTAENVNKPRNNVGINLALAATKKSKALSPNNNTAANGVANRRILSLSQITHNVPTGGLKRSQSVRTAGAGGGRLRKASWTPGAGGPKTKGYGDLSRGGDDDDGLLPEDKENDVNLLKESEEEHLPQEDQQQEEVVVVRSRQVSSGVQPPQSRAVSLTTVDDDAPALPPPVDIVISAPSSVGGDNEEQEVTAESQILDEHENASQHGGHDEGSESESESSETETEGGDVHRRRLSRRSSIGTTVITTTETEADDTMTERSYADPDDDQSEFSDDETRDGHSRRGGGDDATDAYSEWTESDRESESGHPDDGVSEFGTESVLSREDHRDGGDGYGSADDDGESSFASLQQEENQGQALVLASAAV